MRSTIPRIPHLPTSSPHEDDLVLTADEAAPFFTQKAVVSEKTDGISLNIRVSASGALSAALKSDWLNALEGRVRRAADLWVQIHERQLRPLLEDGGEIYGEWLWHKLAIKYDRLPSAALLYSIRDKKGRLIPRKEALAKIAAQKLPVVEPLFEGVVGDPQKLASFCTRSAWGNERGEGLIVEIATKDGAKWAKWVRGDYKQPAARDLTGEKNGIVEASSR